MLAPADEQVVALVAPPGYGKTTVLGQWASCQGRPVSWVSLDKSDNDPSLLLIEAAASLSRAALIDPNVVTSLSVRADSVFAVLSRLAPALSTMTDSVALVFDHLESVDNPESLDVIGEVAARLPLGSQLAVASRAGLPVPAALLRVRRDIAEIGIDELAMDGQEAQLLFASAGVQISDDDVARLVQQTEGWPAGLYLAALASRAVGGVSGGFAFRGDDRLMGDYLRAEVLSHLAPETVEFLTRTAVLDQLSGPLCDAVLDSQGSHAILETLESSNVLLVPLDRYREWYRYHHLFRDLLVAELRRNEPHVVSELHARAARWFEANHMLDAAITHSQAAHDADNVARLVTIAAQPAYATGRAATVRTWFEWFQREGLIERYANVAVLGSVSEALAGQPASAERWHAAAEMGAFDGALPDGSTLEGWRAFNSAVLCRSGVIQMGSDARSAQQTLAPGSPFRAAAFLFEGLSHLLVGEPDIADPIFVHTYDVAMYLGAAPVAAVAAAERALIALEIGAWEDARALSDQAVAIVRDGNLQEYLHAAIVHAVAARVAIHERDLVVAREHVERAAHLRPLLTYAVPVTAQFLLELATAYLGVADPSGAKAVLRDARDIMRQRGNLGVLHERADGLRSALDDLRFSSVGVSSLSIAELRVLPYLPTHLTFAEIADRLHVSRNTVKSQALSVYRKLGAASRGEAVERARLARLLTV
jgi:LuxR family maltose regulon positive regulatory protein